MTRREDRLIALLGALIATFLYPGVTVAIQANQIPRPVLGRFTVELSKDLPPELASRLQPAFLSAKGAVLVCAEDWLDRVPLMHVVVPVRLRVEAGVLVEVSRDKGSEVEAELADCVIEAVRTITPPADLTTPVFVATWPLGRPEEMLPTVWDMSDQYFGGY